MNLQPKTAVPIYARGTFAYVYQETCMQIIHNRIIVAKKLKPNKLRICTNCGFIQTVKICCYENELTIAMYKSMDEF